MIATFASLPSMPLHTAGEYVAAAYTVAGLALIIYVGIMAKRLISNQREIEELRAIIEEREQQEDATVAGRTSGPTDHATAAGRAPAGPAPDDPAGSATASTQEPVA